MALAVRLMGAVTLVRDGRTVEIGGPKQQLLLAVLALSAGRRVSTDRLIDSLWGEDPPATARRTVQSYIASLRRAFGSDAPLHPSQNGYTLDIDRADVDLLAFEDTVTGLLTADGESPNDTAREFLDVLATWDTPLGSLRDAPRLEQLTAPFQELHLQALEGLAAAQIAGTHAGDAVRTLEALVREHPTRENLWLQLAHGLARLGRRDMALHAIQRAREALRDQLGVHPSALLTDFEAELLAGPTALSTEDQPVDASDLDAPAVRLGASPGGSVRADARPRPVPWASTSFVGRTKELTAIADALESARLVTLCGFGGLGKTRLAQETAHTIADRFTDGVWYVDLAPVAAPTIVADTILTAGGLVLPTGRDPVDHLLASLQPANTLIVLDNCEHLVEAVAELSTRIVRISPHVHILTTSRIPLDVADEAVFTVHPLDPAAAHDLLVQRARLARPGFTMDDTDPATIDRLTAHVAGIPLAIELAGARLAAMSLDQLVERLDDHLDLLATGRAPLDPRQQSLTGVIDWSYHLLDPADRQLLRHLTVCTGGFDLEAARTIGATDTVTISLTDTLDQLTHLVHSSLIEFDTARRVPRYRMLEPIRQHLAIELTPTERDAAALTHAEHYAGVASRLTHLFLTDLNAAHQLGEDELANLRTAMHWAYHHDHPRLGLTLARRAYVYFMDHQLHREILDWLRTGLDLIDEDDDDTLEAAVFAMYAARHAADGEADQAAYARIERGFDTVRDPRVRAEMLLARSESVYDTDPRLAEALIRSVIEMGVIKGWRELILINNKFETSWLTGDLSDSADLLRRLDEIEAELPRPNPILATNRAAVASCAGRWNDVLSITAGTTDLSPLSESDMRIRKAQALSALGRGDEAIAEIANVPPDTYEGHHGITARIRAAIELRRDRPSAAVEHLIPLADEITHERCAPADKMHVASLLAIAATDLGQHDTAAILFGHAAAEGKRLDIVLRAFDRPLAEHATERCRTALGADRYDELAAQGAAIEWHDLPLNKLGTT